MMTPNASVSPLGGSRLGFGCVAIPGAHTRAHIMALLETALDCGITHFDTARMYGAGAAEAYLGEIAARRRAEMVIVSKAGITPPPLIGRAARRLLPRIARAAGEPRFAQFAPQQVRLSVETSLRELQTDYLDVLLLHEVSARDITDDLKNMLDALRLEGKVLRYGIATSLVHSATIARLHPDLCDVVQTPVSQRTLGPAGNVRIFHSILGPRMSEITARLTANPALARRVGLNPRDKAQLGRELLRRQMRDGVALFSSASVKRIRENATLLAEAAQCAPAMAAAL